MRSRAQKFRRSDHPRRLAEPGHFTMMSESSFSSHSYTRWIVGILTVLALYVSTWPIVEMKFSTFTTTSSTTPSGFVAETVQVPPAWASMLHLLAQQNGGDN